MYIYIYIYTYIYIYIPPCVYVCIHTYASWAPGLAEAGHHQEPRGQTERLVRLLAALRGLGPTAA